MEKIQQALEQQIVDLSAQVEHIQMHCNHERDALSTCAKRDSEAIEVVFKDLETLRAQHEASLKDLSVQLETSLEESEQRQVERMNETDRQFDKVVSMQESKMFDLETAMEFRAADTNTSISARGNSSIAVVLARVHELEKSLGDMLARAEDTLASMNLQSKMATTGVPVDDLSEEVNTGLKTAQYLGDELDSRLDALRGDMQRLELQVNQFNDVCQSTDARVDDIASQVEFCSKVIAQKEADQSGIVRLKKITHSLQDKTRICEQKVKDLASEVWHELKTLHQEQRHGLFELSARLNAEVSELAHQVSVQGDILSNVEKAISRQNLMGTYDEGSFSGFVMTPSFDLSSFSDARSSIARQSFEGRPSVCSDFMLNSPSRRSRNSGSPNFDTPTPVRNTGGCRIGELAWHAEDRDLDACQEEESDLTHDKSLDVDALCDGQVGLHFEGQDVDEQEGGDDNEDADEDMMDSIPEKIMADTSNRERRMSAHRHSRSLLSGRRRSIIKSANLKCVNSNKPITSVLAPPAITNRAVDETYPESDYGCMGVHADFPKRMLYSPTCKQSDNSHVRFRGDNATCTKKVFFK